MGSELGRWLMVGAGAAGLVAACGITLETAPSDESDASSASSSSSSGTLDSGGSSSSSSSSGPGPASSSSSGDGCTVLDQSEACAGVPCGDVPDGCGGTYDCGGDAACQATSGPNGKCTDRAAHTCACVPNACLASQNCGSIPDGCGGSASCGPDDCGGVANTSCVDHVCTCTPVTDTPCAGKECGTTWDGCSTVTCGAGCMVPETCGGRPDHAPNQCGCTPRPAAEVCTNGKQNPCEIKWDDCKWIDCSDCNSNEKCQYNGPGNANTCVPK